jgi:catechol 2,3-dioxygenase-like lactoylglutathione lyase family enzyme
MDTTAAVKLTKVGHIMLGVRNVSQSLPFYRDALGLTVKWSVEDLVFLDGGGVTLCLRPAPDAGNPGDPMRTEIVFEVEDIDAAYLALRSRGVPFAREPRVVTPGRYAADFRDPDGHVFSIFGPRAGE